MSRKVTLRAPVVVVPQELIDQGERMIDLRADRAVVVVPRGASAEAIERIVDRIPWGEIPRKEEDA